MTFTLPNPLIRRDIVQRANAIRDRTDLMNADDRDATMQETIANFDVVIGVVEHSPGVVSFFPIKGQRMLTAKKNGCASLSMTGLPFASADVARAIAKMYGDGADDDEGENQ